MNNTDKGKVVVAQSTFATVGDQCSKALWGTQPPVNPLPEWAPLFILFEQPGGQRIGGEQNHVSVAETAPADLDPFVHGVAVRPGTDQIRAHRELRRFL